MLFTDVLQDLGISYKGGGSGGHTREGWVNFRCPFCGGGKHEDSMGYNLSSNYLNCYRCGGHSLLSTVAEIASIGFKDAKKLLIGLEGSADLEIADKRGKLVLPKGLKPMSRAHRDYLRSRGFKPSVISEMWGVQGISFAAKLRWRLFIPIYTARAEMVSWTTRSILEDTSVRYLSASAEQEMVNHKSILYGEQYADPHACIVVEGPLDVWGGGPGYLGTCGTGYKAAQVARMAKYLRRGIWYDNEPEAQRRAKRLRDELEAFPGETFLIQSDSKDPGSATEKEKRQVRKAVGL